MKKLFVTYLFAHSVLMALGGVLLAGAVLLSPGWALSPLWALAVLPMGGAAWYLGKRCRVEASANDAWNAATLFYALSLALYFLLWRFADASFVLRALNLWNLPSAPILAGLDAWMGHFHVESAFDYDLFYRSETYKTLVLPLMGALSAAVPPMCFTLGLLSHKKENQS